MKKPNDSDFRVQQTARFLGFFSMLITSPIAVHDVTIRISLHEISRERVLLLAAAHGRMSIGVCQLDGVREELCNDSWVHVLSRRGYSSGRLLNTDSTSCGSSFPPFACAQPIRLIPRDTVTGRSDWREQTFCERQIFLHRPITPCLLV